MLGVVLLTYQRTDYALRTVEGVLRNLHGAPYVWYVADDGSAATHVHAVTEALASATLVGSHSQRLSYGGSMNRGLQQVWMAGCAWALLLEDDWVLQRSLDVSPYLQLLDAGVGVAAVRMGYISDGVGAVTLPFQDRLYLRLDDTHSRHYSRFAWAGHPALVSRKYFEVHGMFPEGLQPGDTELAMAWQYTYGQGVDVVWPCEFGVFGPWGHVGMVQSYEWSGGAPMQL